MPKVKLPGSNQSPSDIETMDMVLNEEGTAFVEAWKPIEEIRKVAIRRFNEAVDWFVAHDIATSIDPDEALGFLRGEISINDVQSLTGDTMEEMANDALVGLRKIKVAGKVSAFKEDIIAELLISDDPLGVIDRVLLDKYLSDLGIQSLCESCYTGSMPEIPQFHELQDIFANLPPDKALAAVRQASNVFNLEKATSEEPTTQLLGDSLVLFRHDLLNYLGIAHEETSLGKISHVVHGGYYTMDRTGTFDAPLKVSPTPIPSGSTSETFAQICDARAVEIWDRNKPIKVFWSGGIDSTTALVALLRNVPVGEIDRLSVYYSQGSIDEYPWFFNQYIDGKVNNVLIQDHAHENNGYYKAKSIFSTTICCCAAEQSNDAVIVTGETMDQVFGSVAFANKPDLITGNLETYLADFSNIREEIDTLNAACPITVNSIPIMLWWWNFALKWDEVKYRMFMSTIVDKTPDFMHFTDTDTFQLWSISNPDKKIKDTPESYKFTAKDYIFDYTSDADYRDTMRKGGSLGVRYGSALAIDNLGNIIRAGNTSINHDLLAQRYGTSLDRFKQ